MELKVGQVLLPNMFYSFAEPAQEFGKVLLVEKDFVLFVAKLVHSLAFRYDDEKVVPRLRRFYVEKVGAAPGRDTLRIHLVPIPTVIVSVSPPAVSGGAESPIAITLNC